MRYFFASLTALITLTGCGVSVLEMGTNLSYAKQQIKNGVDIHAQYEDKETVLFWAAREGSIEMVDFYLSKGADINAKNEWKSSSLHWAVYANQLQMVKHLISNGADITAKDAAGDTALALATSEGFKNISDYLQKITRVDYPAFHKAKKENTLQSYKEFMQNHANSVYSALVEKRIKKRTQELFKNPHEREKLSEKLHALISSKHIKKFIDFINANEKANVFAKNDESLALLFVGPKGLSVGEVLSYKEENIGELVLAAKIKGQKKPYKDFSFDEIKILKKMGVTDRLLAAMLEVTNR